jgi:voltage-gated potassium channel
MPPPREYGFEPGMPIAARLAVHLRYTRAVVRRFYGRLMMLVFLLVLGGLLFRQFWPEHDKTFLEGVYDTFCLMFMETPENFPKDTPLLELLFFAAPLLGLLVLIESIVEFSLLLRDKRRNAREWCAMVASVMKNHVILVGFGKLGYRTYQLLRTMGEKVVVIERKTESPLVDKARREGVTVFCGDARQEFFLEQANCAGAKSIIAATNDDLANLEIALDARRINPNIHVVLRMFDQATADKIREGFAFHMARSEAALSAPAFATSAVDRTILNSYLIEGQLVVMCELTVNPSSQLAGKTVDQLNEHPQLSVIALRRPEQATMVFPHFQEIIRVGDTLIVQTLYSELGRWHEMNGDTEY